MGKIQNTFSAIGKSWKSKPTSKKIYAYLWMLTGVVLAVLIGMFVGLSKTSTVKDETNAKWRVEDKIVQPKKLEFTDANSNNQFDAGEKLTIDGKEVISIFDKGSNVKVTDGGIVTAFNNAQNIFKDFKPNDPTDPRINIVKDDAKLVVANFDLNSKDNKTPSSQETNVWKAVSHDQKANDIYKFVDLGSIEPFVADKTTGVKNVANVNFDAANLTGVFLKDRSFELINGYKSFDFYKNEHGAAVWGVESNDWTLPLTAKAASQQNALAAIGGLFAVSIAAAIFTTAGVEYVSKKKKTGGKK